MENLVQNSRGNTEDTPRSVGILIVALGLAPGAAGHDEVGHSNIFESDFSDLKIRSFPVAGWLNGQALGHSPFRSDRIIPSLGQSA
jgi:hypothetical protein